MEKETFKTAKEVAIECAKRKPKSYYAEPFEPHEWVIDAMEEYGQLCAEQARREGYNEGKKNGMDAGIMSERILQKKINKEQQ